MNDVVLESLRNNEIAKYIGWSQIENVHTIVLGGVWVGYPPKMQIIGQKEKIPCYFNDLNAMHQAEKVFDRDIHKMESLRYMYSKYVYDLTPQEEQPFRASSKIRFEAFLRTIGKWDIKNYE